MKLTDEDLTNYLMTAYENINKSRGLLLGFEDDTIFDHAASHMNYASDAIRNLILSKLVDKDEQ